MFKTFAMKPFYCGSVLLLVLIILRHFYGHSEYGNVKLILFINYPYPTLTDCFVVFDLADLLDRGRMC